MLRPYAEQAHHGGLRLQRLVADEFGLTNLRHGSTVNAATKLSDRLLRRSGALPLLLHLQLEAGDAVRAVQIGDSIVLTPQRMELDTLRKEIRRMMKKHNVSADDLLRNL